MVFWSGEAEGIIWINIYVNVMYDDGFRIIYVNLA